MDCGTVPRGGLKVENFGSIICHDPLADGSRIEISIAHDGAIIVRITPPFSTDAALACSPETARRIADMIRAAADRSHA